MKAEPSPVGSIAKRAFVGGQVDVADEGVGRRDGRDPGEAELLDQPVLKRAERPLRPAAGLRRIGRNVLDPELL